LESSLQRARREVNEKSSELEMQLSLIEQLKKNEQFSRLTIKEQEQKEEELQKVIGDMEQQHREKQAKEREAVVKRY
jgi:hypothetical protein